MRTHLIKKNILTGALCLIMFLHLPCQAYAASTPDISGAFSKDNATTLSTYETAYNWNDSVMTTPAWYMTDNLGNTFYFKRTVGYQKEFLLDNIMTTRQYLGLYVGGDGSGGNIVAVARAQLDNPDNVESPLNSDNVFYNTWYYGREVYNIDANGNGRFDYGDAPQYYPWCCVFVDWCANECGYIDSGLFPKCASCTNMYGFMTTTQGFSAFPTWDTTPMGGTAYTPVPGDLMFFKDDTGAGFGHIGIISDVEDDGFWTIEGNSNCKVCHNYYNIYSASRAVNGQIVHVVYPDTNTGERSQEIYDYLTDIVGLTPAAAAGALGNIQRESGCVPNTMEMGYSWAEGAGYGLIQWTNTSATGRVQTEGTLLTAGDSFYYQSGLRRTNLVNYAVTNGLNYTDLYAQLLFLNEELNHYPTYSSAITRMNACANTLDGAKDAALIWLQYIEGLPPTNSYWSNESSLRQSYTTTMYNKYAR